MINHTNRNLYLFTEYKTILKQKIYHNDVTLHLSVNRRFFPCFMHAFLNFQLIFCLSTIYHNKTFFITFLLALESVINTSASQNVMKNALLL